MGLLHPSFPSIAHQLRAPHLSLSPALPWVSPPNPFHSLDRATSETGLQPHPTCSSPSLLPRLVPTPPPGCPPGLAQHQHSLPSPSCSISHPCFTSAPQHSIHLNSVLDPVLGLSSQLESQPHQGSRLCLFVSVCVPGPRPRRK